MKLSRVRHAPELAHHREMKAVRGAGESFMGVVLIVVGCLGTAFGAGLAAADGPSQRSMAHGVAGAAASAGEGLVINEILADNAATIADPAGEFDDWVELYNRGTEPIALSGHFLSDDPADTLAYALPDVTLAPGAYYLVWCDNDLDQGPDHAGFKLSLSGEQVLLSTASATVDRVAFGVQQTDIATGRTTDGAETWGTCATPSPRKPNTCGGALSPTLTPEATLTPTVRPPTPAAPTVDLVLNEILADNQTIIADPAGEFDDWVELYNRGTAPIGLAGLFLSDDPADAFAYALPDVTLAPGAYYLVWCDNDPDQGPDHAGFKLSLDGEQIVLSTERATIDQVTFGAQHTDISIGRNPDGGSAWTPCSTPSPRGPNMCGGLPTATTTARPPATGTATSTPPPEKTVWLPLCSRH
jgi:hypothetical protein